MNKNSQIHIVIETELLEILKLEAKKSGISLSQYCRQKLLESSHLVRIEFSLSRIEKKLAGDNNDK